MKRVILFFVAAMVMCVSAVTAQERSARYYAEVFFAGDAGGANLVLEGEKVSDRAVFIPAVSLHTIQGAKFGEYVSVGVGIGVDVLLSTQEESAELGGFLIPLYADVKCWIPTKGKVAPFLMADVGCSFLFYPSTAAPLYGAGVGFRSGKFMMSLGYLRDGVNVDTDGGNLFNPDLKYYRHKLQLRIGVTF